MKNMASKKRSVRIVDFRNKYLASALLVLALFTSTILLGQRPDTVHVPLPIPGGVASPILSATGRLTLPNDTFKLARRDSASLSLKKNPQSQYYSPFIWNGLKWDSLYRAATPQQAGLLNPFKSIILDRIVYPASHVELRGLTVAPSLFTRYQILGKGFDAAYQYNPASTMTDDSVMAIAAPGGGMFERITNGYVSPDWWGAKHDGSTNDYVPVQRAIDFAVYNSVNVVLFSAGNYINSTKGWNIWKDVNHNGDPEFVTVELRGQGTSYGVSGVHETTLSANYLNSFLINIQRGKGCKVSNMNMVGNNVLNYSMATAIDPATTYAGPGVRTTPSSPYALLVIDAFGSAITGSNQYPGFAGYYSGTVGSGGSTACKFDNLVFDGGYVDILLTPPGNNLQNDESMTFTNIWLSNAYYGCLVSQKQSRNIKFEHTNSWNSVHTVFASAGLGTANGEMPIIDDLNVAGNIYEIFNGGGDKVSISNIHAESLYRLGRLVSVTAEISNSVINPLDCGSFGLRYPDIFLQVDGSSVQFKNSRIVYLVGPGNKTPINFYMVGVGSHVDFDNCYLSNEISQSSSDGETALKITYNNVQLYNQSGTVISKSRIYSMQHFFTDGTDGVQLLNFGTEWTTFNPNPGADLYQTRTSRSPWMRWLDIGIRTVTVAGDTATCASDFTGGHYGYLVGEVMRAYLNNSDLSYAAFGRIKAIDNDGTIHFDKLIQRFTSGSYTIYYPIYSSLPIIYIGGVTSGSSTITHLTEEVSNALITWPVNTPIYIFGTKRTVIASSAGTVTLDNPISMTNQHAVITPTPTYFLETGRSKTSPEVAAGASNVSFTVGSFYYNIGADTTIAGWQCILSGETHTAYLPVFRAVSHPVTPVLSAKSVYISDGTGPVESPSLRFDQTLANGTVALGIGGAPTGDPTGYGNGNLTLTSPYPTFVFNGTGSGKAMAVTGDNDQFLWGNGTGGNKGHRFVMDVGSGTAGLAINDAPGGTIAAMVAEAMVNMVSTTRGVYIPRMTNTQRNAIGSLHDGLMIYSITDHALEYYNSVLAAWVPLTAGVSYAALDSFRATLVHDDVHSLSTSGATITAIDTLVASAWTHVTYYLVLHAENTNTGDRLSFKRIVDVSNRGGTYTIDWEENEGSDHAMSGITGCLFTFTLVSGLPVGRVTGLAATPITWTLARSLRLASPLNSSLP